MRARLEKQNSHITRFSQKKIDELEGQKNLILKQREFSKDIDWGAIRFDDHRIRIVIDGYLSEPFELPESRKSLEFLKMYIKRSRLVPIRARIFGNRVVSIENLDELKKIIEILSIQDEVNLYLNDFQSTSIDKILSKLKKVSNQHLVDLFRLKDRGPYINFLCEIQSHEYKIIPTSEVLAVNDKTSITEETFLFTTIHKKKVFIIWESTLINRATYVFGSNNNSYSADIQRLFDFIASSQSKKRKRLRYAIKTGEISGLKI